MSEPAADPDEVAQCGACKKTMLAADGVTPRKPAERFGHSCDLCKCPMHAPLLCDAVWFPVVSSDAREFCCLEHLQAYNAECPSFRIVPVRRREDEPLVDCEGVNNQPTGLNGKEDEGRNGGNGDGDNGKKGDNGEGGVENKPIDEGGNGSDGGANDESNEGGGKKAHNEDNTTGKESEKPQPETLNENSKPDDDPKPPGDDDIDEAKSSDLMDAIPEGTRIKVCFDPDSPSWYGGLAGPVGEKGQTFGFDDGEVRFVTFEEMREMKGNAHFLPFEDGAPYGLVAGAKVKHRAEAFTLFKEGRMKEARCGGVLVGYQMHTVGPVPVHAAHHAAGDRAVPDDDEASRQLRRTTRVAASIGAERKGLRTFRCGDVVRCLTAEGNNATATVLGVCNAAFSGQMRRVLVLCEGESRKDLTFFVAAWTAWARLAKQGVAEDSFDIDEDDLVKVASAAYVSSMLQAWEKNQQLKKISTSYQVVRATQAKALPSQLLNTVAKKRAEKPKPDPSLSPPAPAPAPVLPQPRGRRAHVDLTKSTGHAAAPAPAATTQAAVPAAPTPAFTASSFADMQRGIMEQMQMRMAQQMKAMQEQMQAQMQAQMKANEKLQAQMLQQHQGATAKQAVGGADAAQRLAPPTPPRLPSYTSSSARMPSTPNMGAESSVGAFHSFSSQRGECSYTPPDLVSKRQTLAGLLATHAADPACASRAGMIAELRFEIERLERKRVRSGY